MPNTARTPRLRQLACAWAALALVASVGSHAQSLDPDSTPRIVITATRRPILEIDAPAAISVITRRDIETRGADNVLEALRGQTSLSLQGRAVGGRKVLSVRGMDSRHALFLVDGLRIGASDGTVGASDFQNDWIAVEDIERIEVVRGPMSVLYGSEALGGVVNIITRQVGDRWHAGTTVEGSDADDGRGGGGWRTSVRVDGPLAAGWGLRAGAAASHVDAVASPADPRISELERRDKHDGWLGLGWPFVPGHKLDLEHREGRERREAEARERGGRRRYHVTTNDIERWMDSAAWDAAWSPALQTQLRAYGSTIDVVNLRTEGVTVNLPQRLGERVLEGQANWMRAAHALLGGFEARNEALRDPGLPGGRSLLRHRSLYAQDEWRVAEPVTLTLGLRHDDHERYGREWSPRAYAVWRVGGPWTVKGGYSHGFKVPNLKQVVPVARQEGPNTFLGNPDLQPERSNAVEVGVGYDAAPLQLQAMWFDQRVTDLIEVRLVTPGASPGLGTYTYENLAKARLRGLESSAASPLGAGFALALTYTYLDATSGTGQRLERRPRQSAGVRLDWTRGPWRAGLGVEHAADQLLPAATPNTPSQPVPDLTLWSAHASCTLVDGLEVSFGVTNLTNVSLAEKSPLFTQAEAPRTWRATTRWRW